METAIENDLIPASTINRIDNSTTMTEIITIKLKVKLNKNFTKEQKSYILGYATASLRMKHKLIFS